MKTLQDVLTKYAIYETARLTHGDAGDGTAYVLDRLAHSNAIQAGDVAALESVGAFVSVRSYRYAPELRETFIFVPDSVMAWGCPNEECAEYYACIPKTALEYDGHAWTCPACGCSTLSPHDAACLTWPERVILDGDA